MASLIAVGLLTGCSSSDQAKSGSQPASSSMDTSDRASDGPVSRTYTGTQNIELGTSAEEATQISVELVCIDPGTLFLQDGAKTTCGEKSKGMTSSTILELAPGQEAIKVKTSDPAVRYKVKAAYEK